MILFKTPHSKKFVSDRQAGLAWPGLAWPGLAGLAGLAWPGLVDFVVVLVVHPLIIVLQFLMHVQLAQSGMLGFHHYQLASCVHTCMSEKIPLPHFPDHFIIIIA